MKKFLSALVAILLLFALSSTAIFLVLMFITTSPISFSWKKWFLMNYFVIPLVRVNIFSVYISFFFIPSRRFSYFFFFGFNLHKKFHYWYLALREKCRYLEFFWSVFFRIWTEYGEILRKYGPEKLRIRTLLAQCQIRCWNRSNRLELFCKSCCGKIRKIYRENCTGLCCW